MDARTEEWTRLEVQGRHDLEELNCEEALGIHSIENLKEYLQLLQEKSDENARAPPSISQKMNPVLDLLQSFTNAITSASQYEPVACLVWGGIQAVLQCAQCAPNNSKMSDEVVDMIVELSKTLPLFDSYLALFGEKHELQWILQDIFSDFFHFCTVAAQYYRRGYARNWISNFFTPTPQSNLHTTKLSIRRHIKDFKKAVELLHRESVRKDHLEITKQLSHGVTELPDEPSHSPTPSKAKFPISTVNLYRNPTFVAREDVLARVRDILRPPLTYAPASENEGSASSAHTGRRTHGPACCVLHGLPGVGKTQVALEYRYRYRQDYDATFWLEAERDWTLASTYAQISDKLGLVDKKTSGDDGDKVQSLAIQRAREWLQTTDRKWMLIFDNVEDIDDLNSYLPSETNFQGSIIITSQKRITFAVTEIFADVQVEPLTRDEAAKLLFKYVQREPLDDKEGEVARELSDLVDGLPLAIATMGGYVNQSESTLGEFFETVKTSSNAWKAGAVGPVSQYEKNLETVFDIAIRELSEKARALLNVLAFLSPDQIPETIFTTSVKNDSLDFLRSKADLLDMVRELRRRQLVRRDTSSSEPYLSIHRTVQWNVLLQLSKDHKHRWRVFQKAFKLVRDVLPEMSPLVIPEPDKWPKFQTFGPQILSLRTTASGQIHQ